MRFSAAHMLDSVLNEFRKLAADLPGINSEASSEQAIIACLQMLLEREQGGTDFISKQITGFKGLLKALNNSLKQASQPEPADTIANLLQQAEAFDTTKLLTEQETSWLALLARFEEAIITLNQDSSLDSKTQTELARLISNWEAADLKRQAPGLITSISEEESTDSTVLSRDILERYLRDRFKDAHLNLTDFKRLAGGYGKETSLFSVESENLTGRFVVRRDFLGNPVTHNCHLVKKEYHVIKVVHEQGFPAPKVAWLDTEHTLIPGGDFIVMHHSPGVTGGNVFGAKTAISDSLVDTLATTTGKLHNLPPLEELGELTESIYPDAWQRTTNDLVYDYIHHWYSFFLENTHSPSAAIISAFGWLFDHISDVAYPPALLHADIGFHNMLIHEGELSALVDWEFAHVGDPAEDLGIIKNSTGQSIDWDRFMQTYTTVTGQEINPKRIQFFQIWNHIRNASASNIVAARFAAGKTKELKLAYTGNYHMPTFITAAMQLIDCY